LLLYFWLVNTTGFYNLQAFCAFLNQLWVHALFDARRQREARTVHAYNLWKSFISHVLSPSSYAHIERASPC